MIVRHQLSELVFATAGLQFLQRGVQVEHTADQPGMLFQARAVYRMCSTVRGNRKFACPGELIACLAAATSAVCNSIAYGHVRYA